MAQSSTTAPAPGSRRRLILTSLAGIVIVVAVFALLMPQVASYEDAVGELANIAPQWLVALAAAGLLNIAAYPLTVVVAVQGLGYWRGFVQRQSGFLVSNTIPGGGAFAVATQYAVLAHYRVKASLAAAAVSADSIFTYLFSIALPSLALVLLAVRSDQNSLLIALAAVLGMGLVAGSVVAVRIVLRSDAGARKVGRWGERLTSPVLGRLNRPEVDLQTLLISYRQDANDLLSRRWPALLGTNALAQLTPLLVLFLALVGLGAYPSDLSAFEIFAAYALALLLTMIPITPGGLGTVDAALVALLTAFGVPGSVAVAADVVWRLVWFLPQLLSGAAAMTVYVVSRNRARRRATG